MALACMDGADNSDSAPFNARNSAMLLHHKVHNATLTECLTTLNKTCPLDLSLCPTTFVDPENRQHACRTCPQAEDVFMADFALLAYAPPTNSIRHEHIIQIQKVVFSLHPYLLAATALLSNLASVYSMSTAGSQVVLAESKTSGFIDSRAFAPARHFAACLTSLSTISHRHIVEGHLFNELSMLGDLVKGIVNGSVVLPPAANVTVAQVTEVYKKTEHLVQQFKEEHPDQFELVETAVIAAAVMIVAPEVAILLLRVVGFGKSGIVLKTVAAAIQAYLGDVKAGSLFAWLTSLAMRGHAYRSVQFVWGFKVAIASALAMFSTWLKDCLMHKAASCGSSAI